MFMYVCMSMLTCMFRDCLSNRLQLLRCLEKAVDAPTICSRLLVHRLKQAMRNGIEPRRELALAAFRTHRASATAVDPISLHVFALPDLFLKAHRFRRFKLLLSM